MFTKFCQHT